jgi:nucleotide-binding universal stress UspA family protein
MYRTIVVGTDGSAPARAAVAAAGELARRFDVGEVHVVTGYRPITPAELNDLAHQVPDEYVPKIGAAARAMQPISEATTALRPLGIAVRDHVLPVSGAEAILDVADDVGADLIVVGSRGHGVGRRLLLGSISTKVAHHADCSVMIVHAPTDEST